MIAYVDYRFKFFTSNLATALQALVALRNAAILEKNTLPDNMLGDYRDSTGAIVADPMQATWRGRQGTVDAGDPAYFYIHIRSTVSPSQLPFSPADYSLISIATDESAPVLGVWA